MKLKRASKVLAGAVLAIGFAAGANAATYTPDTLLGSVDSANSGAGTTEEWAEGILGTDITLSGDIAFTVLTDDAGNRYLDVDPNEPGYFVLKFGVGGTGVAEDTYLFQNIGELTKLVWTDGSVNFLSGCNGFEPAEECPTNLNTGRLSHVRITDGTTTTVPVPGTLGLLGLGLVALGGMRRRASS